MVLSAVDDSGLRRMHFEMAAAGRAAAGWSASEVVLPLADRLLEVLCQLEICASAASVHAGRKDFVLGRLNWSIAKPPMWTAAAVQARRRRGAAAMTSLRHKGMPTHRRRAIRR